MPTLRDINGETVYHGDRVYSLNNGRTGVAIYKLEHDWWRFYSDIENGSQEIGGIPDWLAEHPKYGIVNLSESGQPENRDFAGCGSGWHGQTQHIL
jgi:hypothetical protein